MVPLVLNVFVKIYAGITVDNICRLTKEKLVDDEHGVPTGNRMWGRNLHFKAFKPKSTKRKCRGYVGSIDLENKYHRAYREVQCQIRKIIDVGGNLLKPLRVCMITPTKIKLGWGGTEWLRDDSGYQCEHGWGYERGK